MALNAVPRIQNYTALDLTFEDADLSALRNGHVNEASFSCFKK